MGWQEVRPGPGRGRKLETLLVKPGGSRQGVCPVGGGGAWPQHITTGVHGKRRQGQLSLFRFSERFHGPQKEAKATEV